MKRVIVDYHKLTQEILTLLVEKFPDGYGIRNIVKFTNHKGQFIEAVEVTTKDTIFLIKISDALVDSMENHDDDNGDEANPLEIDNVIDIENADLEDEDLTNDK